MADLAALAEALIRGDRDTVVSMVRQALDEGMDAEKVLNEGLVAGMDVVGEKFKNNEFYVPEVCLLYTSPSPRDLSTSRMPSSA